MISGRRQPPSPYKQELCAVKTMRTLPARHSSFNRVLQSQLIKLGLMIANIYRRFHPMNKPINIQDHFLNQLRKDNVPVTVYLTNGFQIRGVVRAFDNFTVILDSEGRQQMIYKHAISTFTPQRNINLMPEPSES